VEWRRDDGFEISDDPGRLDREQVWRWLSEQAYWAIGRAFDVVDRSIDGSLCFGVYAPGGAQVGSCRFVTDGATFAWLCDVFVAPAARGQRLAEWMVGIAVNHPRLAGIKQQVLATADAHGLYQRFGFRPFDEAETKAWMRRTE
jgi:GNAT superfamily N-acetyltransferase